MKLGPGERRIIAPDILNQIFKKQWSEAFGMDLILFIGIFMLNGFKTDSNGPVGSPAGPVESPNGPVRSSTGPAGSPTRPAKSPTALVEHGPLMVQLISNWSPNRFPAGPVGLPTGPVGSPAGHFGSKKFH